jgi:hypothetical protein
MEHSNNNEGFIRVIALSTVQKYNTMDIDELIETAIEIIPIENKIINSDKNHVEKHFTQIVNLKNSDDLFKKGIHPNQWFLESIFGKPKNDENDKQR